MNAMSFRIAGLATLMLTTLAATAGAAEPARDVPSLIAAIRRLEFVEMLTAVLNDEPIDSGKAWFHSSQSRYGWKWLAEHMDANHDGAVTPDEFTGPKGLFDSLDRDHDGRLTAEDFDWSDASPYWRQQGTARMLLRRGDADGDGKLTAEEWQALFQKAAGGKDKLTADDLRVLLFPPQPKRPPGPPPEMPSRLTLLLGLLNNEVGSASEGPPISALAPDFTLHTPDGKELSLYSYRGDRPLVLVFGNYTCGPFRHTFPAVEELKKRYEDKVAFLGVYVREAHPKAGWRMESNDKEGVCFPQPETDAERINIAGECVQALKMTMPVVVDGIGDRVGNLYSGMPSRLYIIGRDGRIVYKSGRGPFGFMPGEMEQALVVHLLDQTPPESRPRPRLPAK